MMFDELERRRSESDRHHENRGRLAQVFARYRTQGAGSVVFGKRIDFGLIYIEEPYMSYGCAVDLDDLDEMEDHGSEDDNDDEIPFLPQCTGYVTKWDQDDRGYYRGAWVAISILGGEVGEGGAGVSEVTHYFTFTATALKDFPVPEDESDTDAV